MRDKFKQAQFRLLRLVLVVTGTILFLTTTNPNKVSAMFLVVPFVAIFISLYLIFVEVIHFMRPVADGNRGKGWDVYRPRLLAALLAAFPVLLLVLQSIMNLNRWDVLIAFIIFLLAYIFVSRGFLPVSSK